MQRLSLLFLLLTFAAGSSVAANSRIAPGKSRETVAKTAKTAHNGSITLAEALPPAALLTAREEAGRQLQPALSLKFHLPQNGIFQPELFSRQPAPAFSPRPVFLLSRVLRC